MSAAPEIGFSLFCALFVSEAAVHISFHAFAIDETDDRRQSNSRFLLEVSVGPRIADQHMV